MSKKIKCGNHTLEREHVGDVEALFGHERFRRMVDHAMSIARQHCQQYPLMDKERTITIKLSLKPLVDKRQLEVGIIEYDRAVFSASVGSPTLPSTSVEFRCAVSNGEPYYNLEDPENPLQLTLRDIEDDDTYVPTGKAAAVEPAATDAAGHRR